MKNKFSNLNAVTLMICSKLGEKKECYMLEMKNQEKRVAS